MLGLGAGELIVIAFVLVVVFSSSRMGALGNALGKFVYSFRKAARGEDLVDVTPTRGSSKVERTPGQPREPSGN